MRIERRRRIGNEIQRLLPELIRNEVRDPRVTGLITVTDVDVSPDLAHAKVFVTALGEPGTIEVTLLGLRHCAPFLRSELARRLRMRTIPELRFVYDASVERGARLSQLIQEAVASEHDGPHKKR